MSKYRNAVYYDFKSRFLVIFFSSYRHRLVLKIPFLENIFPKISKYCTENLHFPSTDKYYVSSPFPPTLNAGTVVSQDQAIRLPKIFRRVTAAKRSLQSWKSSPSHSKRITEEHNKN